MSVGAVNKQTGDRIPTAGMPAIDNALDLMSVNPVQNAVITAALAGKADTGIVADDFDSTASYVIGNYCIENSKLYRFKANHSGAWAAADVDEIQIAGELATLKNGLTNLATDADSDFIQIVMSGDGRYYEYSFTHPFTLNRVMFMVMRGTQLGSVTLSTAMYFSNFSDAANVISSDANITYELVDGTFKLKVDAGSNAWVDPVIIMPRYIYKKLA